MKTPGWTLKRDALLLPALYVLNVFFFSSWLQLGQLVAKPWLLLVWLYGLLMLVPLVWRDRAPVVVFALQWLLTVLAWPFMPIYTPVVGVPLALYTVAVLRSRKESLLALLASAVPVGLGAAVAFRVYSEPALQLQSFIPNAILLVIVTIGAWGAGRVARASQQHVQYLETERETVREAVAAERSRIARELHDIVSHAVTAMVLQAAGAARIANTNFAQVKQSLGNIETTGRRAMAELRRLLGVLEAADPDGRTTGIAELGPQPGLADMHSLLSSLRATGMVVTVHVEGTPKPLDQSIDLAAYRIVQEGLTNVLKHAGVNSRPRLQLTWEAENLIIQIDNDINFVDANRRRALSVGRGLAGLRARAHAAGGQLRAGPTAEGGYQLCATLPLDDSAQRIMLDRGRRSRERGASQGRIPA
jgi:signal transduction histidine kinase